MKTHRLPIPKPGFILPALLLSCLPLGAQVIPNPSFEEDTFTTAPGFIANNGPITGWTGLPTNLVGLGSPAATLFADNGAVPDGSQRAFLRAINSNQATLSTTATGLTIGTTYKVSFRINARSTSAGDGNVPFLIFSTDGEGDPVPMEVRRVEPANSFTQPYRHAACEFTATATAHEITLTNNKPSGDHTVIVDDFRIEESSGGWTVSPWTGDADSGIDSQYVHTHAYNFAGNAPVTVNGVPFLWREFNIPGRFTTTGLASTHGGRDINLTGDSAQLARAFRYGGSPSITLDSLKPNTEYVFTIYGYGWDGAGDATPHRAATFSSSVPGSDRLTVNLNRYGQNNGITVAYTYTTDSLGSPVTIHYPPTSDGTFHTGAFTNREAAPGTPPAAWSTEAWTSDEDSGISGGYHYTHAFNFNSGETPNVNGVNFQGIAGAQPVAENYSSVLPTVFNNDTNNFISGYGAAISQNFVYGGPVEVHQLSGLTPGKDYVFTIYSTGWEDPGGRINAFVGSGGEGVTLLDQNEFGNNNGIRMEYRYTANHAGTLTITTSSIHPENRTIHVCGISNREADPLVNTPPFITLAPPEHTSAGVGEDLFFRVAAGGSGVISYQWQFNGEDIIGENQPQLEIYGIDHSRAGSYTVVITNDTPTAVTHTIEVSVLDPVPGLFSTGVGQDGISLPNGEIDSHYTLITNPDDIESDTAWIQTNPPGSWFPNSDTSKWIGPLTNTSAAAAMEDDAGEGPGTYVYRTHIDLTNFDPATVRIEGSWATDNNGLAIRINGEPVPGLTIDTGSTFGALRPFRIDSSNAPGFFTEGINTIDFVVNNSDVSTGFTGLRVDGLRAFGLTLPNSPPHIAAQPRSITGPHYGVATLAVGASGSGPLSYEWYRNGQKIDWAAESTLQVFIEDLNSGGLFKVIVFNHLDSVESDEVEVIVTNSIPVAVDDFFETGTDEPLFLDFLFDLLANDTDADGDFLELTGISSSSAQGGTVVEQDGQITYTPPPGFSGVDSFTYTVNDGFWGGVSEPGTVFITVGNPPAASEPGRLVLTLGEGAVTGTFTGAPGANYTLQRSTTLEPGSWIDIDTIAAPPSGVVEITDSNPPPVRAFYRIAYQP